MKSNPQVKFAQAVNDAIMHHVEFYIYRTVDGRVQQLAIRMIDVDVASGEMWIDFKIGEQIKFEKASEQDLLLISERAKQLQKGMQK